MTAARKQCKKCPWKKGTNPHEIPDGYRVELHQRIACTIATEASSIETVHDPLRVMGCHEHPSEARVPCVGWIVHQLGPGNNIALRLRVALGKFDANVQAVGPQHERFGDTLPR